VLTASAINSLADAFFSGLSISGSDVQMDSGYDHNQILHLTRMANALFLKEMKGLVIFHENIYFFFSQAYKIHTDRIN